MLVLMRAERPFSDGLQAAQNIERYRRQALPDGSLADPELRALHESPAGSAYDNILLNQPESLFPAS